MVTWTPRELAELLGVNETSHVRVPLRERHPDREKYTRWHLGRDDIEYVSQWNVEQGYVDAATSATVTAHFESEQKAQLLAGRGPIEADVPEYDEVVDEGPVRAVASKLLSVARHGGSILVDHDVWTDENIETLVERFVKQPDVSGETFFVKLRKQLSGVTDDVRLLFAEVFALQMLPTSQFRPATKIRNVEWVLREAEGEYLLPDSLIAAFEAPVFNGGVAFATRRFQQLSVLIELVRYLRSVSEEEIETSSEVPLAWREIVRSSPGTSEPSLRASLVYLGHPDYFFPIVSEAHKRAIVSAFFPQVTKRAASGDLDVDLASLRAWMAPEPGVTPNFYTGALAPYWLVDEEAAEREVEAGDDVDETQYTVDSIIAEGAFHPAADLRAIVERWVETRNVVLQGAPGTGKTWLARRLAFALIGRRDEEAVRSVQFHPGTSYEDFVRGWRPAGDGRLILVDGPLIQHALRARENPDIPHVLIIEEFNRGNPAQALGEMLTLLERSKRNEADALELTYSRDGEASFWLPDNLYVVGTMNTADRSLALVDFALRRRFAFFDLQPQLGPSWTDHLSAHFRGEPRGRIDEIARRVVELNRRISEDASLGSSFQIGHSYFTAGQEASELEPWFRSVVQSSVRPQLAEYWHEAPDTVAEVVGALLAEL